MSACTILLILAAVFFFLALIPQNPPPGRMVVPWQSLGFLVATLAALVYVGGIHGVR